MNCGCWIAIAGLGLTIVGGQGVYTGLKNRKPTVIPIEDIQGQDLGASWLRVTGGELDVLNSTYLSLFGVGDATEIYVPVVAPGVDSSTDPVHVVLLTRDRKLVDFLNDANEIEDPAAGLQFLADNIELARPQRDIEGLAQMGMTEDKDIRKVRDNFDNLSENAVILKEGEKPSLLGSIAALVGGLLILGFGGLMFVPTSEEAAEGGGEGDGGPAAPPPVPNE